MNVYWVNVANAKVGKTQLTGNGINAESPVPAAVNGTAATGEEWTWQWSTAALP